MVAPDAGLVPRLQEEELEEHLEKTARLGGLLGLSAEELALRLEEAADRVSGERLTKEKV